MNLLSRHPARLVSLLVVLILCLSAVTFAQGEKKLSPKQLPAAVQASFHKVYPSAKIKGASSEVENGKTLYEVESVDGKVNRDLLYSEDGTAVEVEETIALKALPAEVSKALKTETGKGKVQKAEKLMKGESVQYEFLISSGKERREVVIDPSGKIVKTTKMKAKEKEEEEKD
jgi:Putative beta-lactamase-inhibitor-like, PepSY-like